MDKEFKDCMISTPLADIPAERLKRIQEWLILAFKKMEFGVVKGLDAAGVNVNLTPSQLQVITSTIWNTTFRVPVLELLQEEEIYKQLKEQKIRPMTCDDIFESMEMPIRDM